MNRNNSKLEIPRRTLRSLIDGEYFELIDTDNEKMVRVVRCRVCYPTIQLRASLHSNGNLIKHMQRKHPSILNKVRREKSVKSRIYPSRKNSTEKNGNQDEIAADRLKKLKYTDENKLYAGSKIIRKISFNNDGIVNNKNDKTIDAESMYLHDNIDENSHDLLTEVVSERFEGERNSNHTIANLKRPHLLDGDYFVLVKIDEDKRMKTARCRICEPDIVHLRTSTCSNTNLFKHIKRKHTSLLNKIKREKCIKFRGSKIYQYKSISDVTENATGQNEIENDIDPLKDIENKCDQRVMQIKPKAEELQELFIETKTFTEHNDNFISQNNEETIEAIGVGDLFSENVIRSNERIYNSSNVTLNATSDTNLLKLQKELMLREFEELQEMRKEKHKLEIEILRKELQFKTEEHQKKLQYLDRKLFS